LLLQNQFDEVWDSFSGDKILVWWFTVEKLIAKYNNTPTFKLVCEYVTKEE
jgi:hypothetical protein